MLFLCLGDAAFCLGKTLRTSSIRWEKATVDAMCKAVKNTGKWKFIREISCLFVSTTKELVK